MNWGIIGTAWRLLFANRAKVTDITNVYLQHIGYLKEELRAQKEIIEQHRQKHPENGKELDEWKAREEKLHKELIKAIQLNRDLKEEIIFKDIEIKQLKKKQKS